MYKGACNQCGRCCRKLNQYQGRDVMFSCANLVEEGNGKTRCAVHRTRQAGMAILMFSEDMGMMYLTTCSPDYPRQRDAVPPECSFEFVPDELVQIQPEWNKYYATSA